MDIYRGGPSTGKVWTCMRCIPCSITYIKVWCVELIIFGTTVASSYKLYCITVSVQYQLAQLLQPAAAVARLVQYTAAAVLIYSMVLCINYCTYA